MSRIACVIGYVCLGLLFTCQRGGAQTKQAAQASVDTSKPGNVILYLGSTVKDLRQLSERKRKNVFSFRVFLSPGGSPETQPMKESPRLPLSELSVAAALRESRNNLTTGSGLKAARVEVTGLPIASGSDGYEFLYHRASSGKELPYMAGPAKGTAVPGNAAGYILRWWPPDANGSISFPLPAKYFFQAGPMTVWLYDGNKVVWTQSIEWPGARGANAAPPARGAGILAPAGGLGAAKVEVAVLDDRGRFIPGIPKGNFRILQNGLIRQISDVSNIEPPNRAYLLTLESKDDVKAENIKVELINAQTGKPLSITDQRGKPVKYEIIVRRARAGDATGTVGAEGVEAQVRLARLLPSVQSSRANAAGEMRPPSGSLFLWVMVEIAKAEAVPLFLDVYNVSVKNAAGKAYPVFGVLSSPVETPIVANAFRPVGTGAPGQAWVETYANSSGDGFEFRLNNPVSGRDASAKLTLKKLPARFSLFFVVPAAVASYTLSGLVSSELSTGELSLGQL